METESDREEDPDSDLEEDSNKEDINSSDEEDVDEANVEVSKQLLDTQRNEPTIPEVETISPT